MRKDTMLEERWRVHVVESGGRVTHGSTFKSEASAKGYFDSLAIAGSTKTLERRSEGASLYEVVLREEMKGEGDDAAR